MLMLPSCDQRLLFLVRVFRSNSRCLALLINTPVSWSIWAMKIETQGFCSTRLRLSDLKVNHDCMRCPGTVHQNVVVCDNVWPRQRSPPKKTVLFTSFHSPPIQGNKKIKKGRPNHRLPQRLQSSCNFSIQRCDFCHFAKKLLPLLHVVSLEPWKLHQGWPRSRHNTKLSESFYNDRRVVLQKARISSNNMNHSYLSHTH